MKDLEITKPDKIVVGAKQTLRAIKEGNALKVYIAQDADTHVVSEVNNLAKENGLSIIYVKSKHELGRACKIQVNAATVAILA